MPDCILARVSHEIARAGVSDSRKNKLLIKATMTHCPIFRPALEQKEYYPIRSKQDFQQIRLKSAKSVSSGESYDVRRTLKERQRVACEQALWKALVLRPPVFTDQ